MRYIVYGAGAVGGAIGGRLAHAGCHVTLIARGAHLDALRRDGLRLVTPDEELHPPLDVAGSPAEARPQPGDVIVLAMKSQDTEAALRQLDPLVDHEVAVVCAQNGVDNERMAARRGLSVYGIYEIIPATHLEPGVVLLHAAPVAGVLDVGRYPAGVDDTAQLISADLRSAQFESRPDPAIMNAKYVKLLGNLGNALDAACGGSHRRSDLYTRARDEAMACYEAAGIALTGVDDFGERRSAMSPLRPAGGMSYPGTSSWQSLARSTGSVESDWLNGEIVLLGRLHGVATPVNEVLRRIANRLAHDGIAPGSLSPDAIEEAVRLYETKHQGRPA